MRYSNYMFSKGSIVFVRVAPSSDNAYLNGRPLIVISNPTHIMNTLLVCTTGTRDKPGIEISLYNYYSKSFCGDVEISKIYPYNILTIYASDIVSSLGQLDPFIMKELDAAIDFHLGRTDIVPGYLKNIEEELCGVTYNTIAKKLYTQEMIKTESLPTMPKYAAIRAKDEEKTIENIPSGKPDKITKSEPTKKPKNSKNSIVTKWMECPNNTSSDELRANCRNDVELVKLMDESSVAMIVSRVAPVSLIAEKYNIGKQHASYLRITLTNVAIEMARLMLTTKGVVRSKNPPDYILIGMVLLNTFSPEKVPDGSLRAYTTRINDVVSKYSIDTTNRKTWKAVEIFNSN